MNVASTRMTDVLIALASFGTGFEDDGIEVAAAALAALIALASAGAGAGVLARLGSALMVRSLPCVVTIALANSVNFVSRSPGIVFLARA
jgi:hypothetical protein